jgi:FkbM family methyltransferase
MRVIPDEWLKDRGTFEHGADDTKTLLLKTFGVWLNLDPRDESLTPCLIRDGYWESWVSLAVARYVKPGYVCVDAGAHIGYYTALFVALGAKFVIAIEPNEMVSNRLIYMTTINGLKQVEFHRVALGKEEGTMSLNEYGKLTGSMSSVVVPGYEVTNKIAVPMEPLDKIVRNLDSVDFIKMDIEGGEVDAWEGMQETMAKFKPTVAMEVAIERGYDLGTFVEHIRSSGTKVEMIGYDGDIHPLDIETVVKERWAMLWLTR